ncbi:MAG: hypothetical protein QOG59_2470 [Solirubrobacteraceae bacterium]|jgi:hypothetical protein|nr:hypothetical protein [Solirubrobacteraceae bacterium]
MADRALDVYLTDHLAGATLGADLAKQLIEHGEGTPLAETMRPLAAEIEEDREALKSLMDALGTSPNPVKVATGWIAEKASRIKFSGLTAGEPELGTYLALETMSLGVAGKISLWEALQTVAASDPALTALDFDALIARGRSQRVTLERERLAAAPGALAP